jgi:Tol biopolymer transport system component
MALAGGARLGPYEIVGPLGAGGMGEVYRAKDSRLNRTVAIKILSDASAADPDRRERFEREAKAISALDHPNICPLYDVGDHQGTYFLVMPCLEGETLADRLTRGPVPVDQAIKIAIEIATALDVAHRHDIIHRDLKPGNIMLTKGSVKLLDFGLAKLKKAEGPLGETTMVKGTGVGTLLGTMPYMSPEQIEGRDVDARSDIFSLGAVIYEMLTGQRAFKGDTPASVIGAILKDEPPSVAAAVPVAPPALEHLVSTCLAKDPEERWQSAADVARELKWIAKGGARAEAAPPAQDRRRRWWPAIAAGIAVLIAGVAWSSWGGSAPEPALMRFSVQAPPEVSFVGNSSTISVPQFAISPDARNIAFVAARPGESPSLWMRPLSETTSRELAGTDGATEPFWSPDSRMIGFFAGGRLKTIQVATGEVRDICAASRNPRGAAWNGNGVILFGGDSGLGLTKVTVATGALEAATDGDGGASSHRWPDFLQDGRRFLYYARGSKDHRGIYVGSVDGTPPVRVLETDFNAVAVNGYLVTLRDGALVAYPFDDRTATVSGDPIQVVERVSGSSTQRGAFSVSDAGVLVHASDLQGSSKLTWFDRAGRESDASIEPGNIPTFSLAPDGRKVALTRLDPERNTADIWINDLERGAASRLTLDPDNDVGPVWSPDGRQIVFRSDRSGMNLLYRKGSAGGATDEALTAFDASNPTHWSPDGRFILFFQVIGSTSADIGLANIAGVAKREYVVNTAFDEFDARFSPDGQWLSYVSNESGKAEVYVQPFPTTGSKWTISSNGGSDPRWRADGRELFYLAADGRLMAVAIDTSNGFRALVPQALFQTRIRPATNIYHMSVDVTPDGQRFMIKTPADGVVMPALTIVINSTLGQNHTSER